MAVLLAGLGLVDELFSGIPVLATPDVEHDLGASHALAALAVLVLPGALGVLLEAPLLVLADRRPRKWFIAGGITGMGVCGLVAALAPSLTVFTAALALGFTAGGVGINLAEATLVDARFDDVEQVMTRWTLLGLVGDLVAPAVFGGLIALGGSWRLALGAVSMGVVLYGLALCRAAYPETSRDDADEPRASLWDALRNPWLMTWVFAESLCDLLDETLVVFASLRLRNELGASPAEQSLVLGTFVAGGALGLLVLGRLLHRVSPLKILIGTAIVCAASYAAWLATTSLVVGAGLLFVVGLTAAPLFPLTSAMEYRQLPGASGTVNAVGYVFEPLSIATPLFLGWLAEHQGLDVALAALLLEPLGIGIIALLYARAVSRGSLRSGAS